MKIYIDVLLIYNFIIDYLLLMSVAAILKRRVSFYRLGAGAFIGSFSVLFLFFPFNSLWLMILKLGVSMIMIFVTFSYRDMKTFLKNLGYLYVVSIFLGGGIYLWNTAFSMHNMGLKFVANSYQLNFFGLLILSPLFIAYYVRKMKTVQEQYQYYYPTDICYKGNVFNGVGFLDSGNTLTWKRRPVVLVAKKKIDFTVDEYTMIPYQALNSVGIVKCFPADYLMMHGQKWQNIYLGVMENDIGIDGVDFLLNREMMEVHI